MAVTLAVALRLRLLRVVDVSWGVGFGVVAVVAYVVALGSDADPVARRVIVALVLLWSARLALHLLVRNRELPEDPRYAELVEDAPGSTAAVAVRKVFLPQGVAMLVVSLPIQVGMYATDLIVPLAVAGVVVWAVGLFFEAVGDRQLARFKADPANKGQVMDRGLWSWTRHPNYFGDACVWWGIWLVAASSWWGLATVISPALMTWTLVRNTGKATLERSMSRSKPGYADYVRRTSGFVPLPPRRRPRARRGLRASGARGRARRPRARARSSSRRRR